MTYLFYRCLGVYIRGFVSTFQPVKPCLLVFFVCKCHCGSTPKILHPPTSCDICINLIMNDANYSLDFSLLKSTSCNIVMEKGVSLSNACVWQRIVESLCNVFYYYYSITHLYNLKLLKWLYAHLSFLFLYIHQ